MVDELLGNIKMAVHSTKRVLISGRLKRQPTPKQTIEDSGIANWQHKHDTNKGNFLFSNEAQNMDFYWSKDDKYLGLYDDRDRSKLTFEKKWNKTYIVNPNKIEYREIGDDGYTIRERRVLVPGTDPNIIKRKVIFTSGSMRYQKYSNGDINFCRKQGFGFIGSFPQPTLTGDDNIKRKDKATQNIVKEDNTYYHVIVIDPVWFNQQTEVVIGV